MLIYTNTYICWIHTGAMNNRGVKTSFEKIYLWFYCKVCVWEGVGDWTKTAIYWPPLLWSSALCLSRSSGLLNWRPRGPLNRESRGSLLLGGAFLYHILSPTPDFLLSPSFIIVQSPIQSPIQSPTQSLEWHVWLSSSGNNCHAVQRSLSSGASVYGCIMGFYLVPFCLSNPPTRFISITGHWNVSLPSGVSLGKCHICPGRRSIYNTSQSINSSVGMVPINKKFKSIYYPLFTWLSIKITLCIKIRAISFKTS